MILPAVGRVAFAPVRQRTYRARRDLLSLRHREDLRPGRTEAIRSPDVIARACALAGPKRSVLPYRHRERRSGREAIHFPGRHREGLRSGRTEAIRSPDDIARVCALAGPKRSVLPTSSRGPALWQDRSDPPSTFTSFNSSRTHAPPRVHPSSPRALRKDRAARAPAIGWCSAPMPAPPSGRSCP